MKPKPITKYFVLKLTPSQINRCREHARGRMYGSGLICIQPKIEGLLEVMVIHPSYCHNVRRVFQKARKLSGQ